MRTNCERTIKNPLPKESRGSTFQCAGLVRRMGLEPTRPCGQQILSPAKPRFLIEPNTLWDDVFVFRFGNQFPEKSRDFFGSCEQDCEQEYLEYNPPMPTLTLETLKPPKPR